MRFSGRTAITANITVSEPEPPSDSNTPLKFSMEGYTGRPPASLVPFYWWPGWNSPQAINKYLEEPNGTVKNGDSGIELLNKTSEPIQNFTLDVPELFRTISGELQLIPEPEIFGSEELSARGEAISELIHPPYLLLNEKEAALQKLKAGDPATLKIGETNYRVIIKTDNRLSDGLAGLSLLLPGMDYVEFPAAGKLTGV
jgi:NADH-quinone oxidoreductase subunit G